MQLPLRVHGWRLLLAGGLLVLAGCAGPSNRQAIFDQLDPAPMSPAAWARSVATYYGPIRSTTQRNGFEGESVRDVRLDLAGSTDAPQVVLKDRNAYSTAWTAYGEREGIYTNIPEKRYGTQGPVVAATHAPNQLVLKVRRNGFSPTSGVTYLITFNADGSADVDLVGHNGWRGEGELWRSPKLLRR